MSTGYLTLFYKSNLIESYIRNFLMTKYISLNNAIGANKLISKIKYYHRNYFCFVNKEKNSIRCIIKLNKITNYQIVFKIKSQQELSLNDLKKSDLFREENVMIQNFFDLEKNSDLIYLNNKINLLIKESNNIYEFNCILLEDSIDMGIFEKIKKCMQDKENTHSNEVQNNLRNNPFISNILNYQQLENKILEKNGGRNRVQDEGYICDAQNEKNEKNKENNLFDMKYQKYFLFDKLLTNINDLKEQFFDKNKLNDYIDLNDKYNSIFPLSDKIFKNSLEKLDNIDNINFDDIKDNDKTYKIEEVKEENITNDNIEIVKDNTDDENNRINNDINYDNNYDYDNKIIPESRYIYRKEDNNSYYNNYKNPQIFIPNSNRHYYNNYSTIKDDQRYNDRYKRSYRYNTFYHNNNYYYKKYNYYNDNYKKNLVNNSFSNDNDTNTNNTTSNPKESKDNFSDNNDNNNKTEYNNSNSNNNYRYYHPNNNETNDNKFFGRYNKYQYRNSYVNRDNNYFNRKYNDRFNDRSNERYNERYIERNKERYDERFNKRYDDRFDNRYKDRYGERNNYKFNNNSNYDNNKNFTNNNYQSSNDNSFNSGIKNNYSRSRDKSPTFSPIKMNRYYRNDNRIDSNRDKSYDNSYDSKYNERNKISNNTNYYGDNNNINYFYNINNYYRQGSLGRWKDNNYFQKGGSYQRNKNDQFNNNDYYRESDNNINNERSFSPEKKSEEQKDDY